MDKISMKNLGFGGRVAAIAALVVISNSAHAAYNWHDWTSTFTGGGYAFTNASVAGTISGFSGLSQFASSPGAWGMPNAIQNGLVFTDAFQIHGINGLNGTAQFNFSAGYGWGSGGRMTLGGIHNYYEYTISAWDASNNPIDVNNWSVLTEFPSTAPGTSGYFSTSLTGRSASGFSSKFFVNDPSASNELGQGGLMLIDGLVGVSKLEIQLTNSSLGANSQQVDLFFMNFATPAAVPEPSTWAAMAFGLVALARRRGARSRPRD